jgi:hypothetical protein
LNLSINLGGFNSDKFSVNERVRNLTPPLSSVRRSATSSRRQLGQMLAGINRSVFNDWLPRELDQS